VTAAAALLDVLRVDVAALANVLGAGVLLVTSPAVASAGAGAGVTAGPVRTPGGALVVAGALLFVGNVVATVVRRGGTAMLGGSDGASTPNPEAHDGSDR